MRFAITFLLVAIIMSATAAQATDDTGILFAWGDTLYVQPTNTYNLQRLDDIPFTSFNAVPTTGINAYDWQDSPIDEPPVSWGFYQGVWSDDGTQFAYGLIQEDIGRYRVMVYEAGQSRIVYESTFDERHAYLLPIAWHPNGNLILIERTMLHNLRQFRLWQLADDGAPIVFVEQGIPRLKGNSASLGSQWVFIGFDTIGLQGYLYDIVNLQFYRFNSQFTVEEPPRSIFEVYPVQVYGVVDLPELETWQAPDDLSLAPMQNRQMFAYPLPSEFMSITCYPDSEYTSQVHGLACAGMQTPRAYEGHQGTDVGGRPFGLPIATPVYASTRGVVIDTLTVCEPLDVSCGDAYGNIVLMEHTRVWQGNTETWFTGYAHLDTVLVQPYTFIHEIGVPIALSGDSGLGGAHLHFEVRSPEQPISTNWLDPFDDRPQVGETSLIIGGLRNPLSSVYLFPPEASQRCTSAEGNNIRAGAGTSYAIVTETSANTTYDVIQTHTIDDPRASGVWLHIYWDDRTQRGWIWAELMDCIDI
jgi:murein DD-endopeptidase MepM/ murein hydrolase activator NlpD